MKVLFELIGVLTRGACLLLAVGIPFTILFWTLFGFTVASPPGSRTPWLDACYFIGKASVFTLGLVMFGVGWPVRTAHAGYRRLTLALLLLPFAGLLWLVWQIAFQAWSNFLLPHPVVGLAFVTWVILLCLKPELLGAVRRAQ
jgi:hypothetical protein